MRALRSAVVAPAQGRLDRRSSLGRPDQRFDRARLTRLAALCRGRRRRGRPRRRRPGSGSRPAPWIGTRTVCVGRLRAAVGQPARLVAEQPGGRAGERRRRRPARRGRRARAGRRPARSGRRPAAPISTSAGPRHGTTSRWNRLPALARTALPLYGSTEPPANTTASAPAASAVRRIVPALPGSFGSTSAADQPRPARERVVERRRRRSAADRDQPLRRDRLGQRGGGLVA